MSWFGRLVDSKDASVEAHVVVFMVIVGVALFLAIWSEVVLQKPVDFQAFCTGMGLLLTGLGFAAAGQGVLRKQQGGPDGN
ncbi:hypothetical protein [Telmatospirillum sp.]|uniref:hypothetical protein n=1 Tax=Telmatospirillum sp. TaxID=2079197 RepID=UPI00284F8585|nr:hypothetical protein [Telmatospirillum sp.]MDR3436457.1 hypothetical protein [Telmatospirillum sp.]